MSVLSRLMRVIAIMEVWHTVVVVVNFFAVATGTLQHFQTWSAVPQTSFMLRNNERCRILVFCSKYTSNLMCLLCILSCVWSPLKGRLCNQHCLSVNRIAQKVKNVEGLWIADREELFRFWGLLTENGGMATILDFCYNVLNRDYRNHTARALYGDTIRK